MRAVLDFNVLARAVYSVGGPAEEVALRLTVPPHVLIVSDFLLMELRRVLRYPRLRRVHGFDDQKIGGSLNEVPAFRPPWPRPDRAATLHPSGWRLATSSRFTLLPPISHADG